MNTGSWRGGAARAGGRVAPGRAAVAALARGGRALRGALWIVAAGPACDDASVTADGFPIALPATGGSPDPAGGLVALARRAWVADRMAIDTGSPLTFVRGQADGVAHMTRWSFDILGASPGDQRPMAPAPRVVPRHPCAARQPGSDGPGMVLGADVLRGFSLQIDFGATPTLTMWSGQRAPDSFLGAAQCGVR